MGRRVAGRGYHAPRMDALELTWFTPLEARDPAALAEFESGQSALLLQALNHLGV